MKEYFYFCTFKYTTFGKDILGDATLILDRPLDSMAIEELRDRIKDMYELNSPPIFTSCPTLIETEE
jgi:hypothetical protein